ncbi:hypothetical protein [Streptacidiphilus sp. EB103A]|uniref:hypothetical protein n=1 Tax=Streptacidiphilus sp. EB103A TaxID=3156275 RepID=UPI0035151FF7
MNLPAEVVLNAWTGDEAAHGDLDANALNWGSRKRGLPHSQAVLEIERPADPTCWAHPNVGYGVLLPEPADPHLSNADRAGGVDAPQAVRDLIAARPGTVLLRWSPELGSRFLRRYFPDGTSQDSAIGLTAFGVGRSRLPMYVVIVAGPDTIPWSVQYALGTRHAVGRLPLAGEALANYVRAMLSDWKDAPANACHALMWTVDHGSGDITAEMRAVIAQPLATALTPPPLSRLSELTHATASGAALVDELSATCPVLVVTSSHGHTWPLNDPRTMRNTLGLPVDIIHNPLPLAELNDAMPGGAVWYAQACCSAGADATSHYTGLLRPGTTAFSVTSAVAALGSMVAPAAMCMLGRTNPVRAVFGHVEPTFNWTLRVQETGQGLGQRIVSALSSHLFSGQPLGYTFAEYRADVGTLHTQWTDCYNRLANGDTSVEETMTRLRLTALDRQSLVLLGDPTVALLALV